jgi:hypothetical protein
MLPFPRAAAEPHIPPIGRGGGGVKGAAEETPASCVPGGAMAIVVGRFGGGREDDSRPGEVDGTIRWWSPAVAE